MNSVAHHAEAAVRPKRVVSLKRDRDDFVVSSWPGNVVIFRNQDAEALRKACRFLHWQIVSDLFAFAGESETAHDVRPSKSS
jgi:hypothetical protein